MDLEALMNGKSPILSTYSMKGMDSLAKAYNPRVPLLVSGRLSNGGVDSDFIFRELLMPSNERIPRDPDFRFYRGTYEIINSWLGWLYKLAYMGVVSWDSSDSALYGKYALRPVLETKDSIELVKIEDRMTDYNKLVAIDTSKSNRIISKGGKTAFYFLSSSIVAQNLPIAQFLGRLFVRTRSAREYIENRSGIAGCIDVALDVNPGDPEDINRSLAQYGLQLQKAKMPMKTLVIRDAGQ